jgi:serine/threonine-protein kinase HipA
MTTATVRLWGRDIGAVAWDQENALANFEYDHAFRGSGIEIAPLTMPLSGRIYNFPALPRETFHGLPGLLADSLPDDFGNALINAWLAREGRSAGSFNPVERLCYTGIRGMGALEYQPAIGPVNDQSVDVDVAALIDLASEILTHRNHLEGSFLPGEREETLRDILRVGTSAGGARAKAIIAWNSETDEVRSGQVNAGAGFTYWLLKFDGVSGNRDKELEDPVGFGLIEYAYYLMAQAAGIHMSECRLLQENGRNHFMTRRFDRTGSGSKLHMQTLGALEHFDYRQPGAYSYEQALRTIRRLELSMETVEEQFRRAAFNIIGRNQDDHVKNIAFLMDRSGQWSLSPAYDVTYSYNPTGIWTGSHQMSLNGKRDRFTLEDLEACAQSASMKRGVAAEIVRQVHDAVARWPVFAEQAGVAEADMERVRRAQRLDLLS